MDSYGIPKKKSHDFNIVVLQTSCIFNRPRCRRETHMSSCDLYPLVVFFVETFSKSTQYCFSLVIFSFFVFTYLMILYDVVEF